MSEQCVSHLTLPPTGLAARTANGQSSTNLLLWNYVRQQAASSFMAIRDVTETLYFLGRVVGPSVRFPLLVGFFLLGFFFDADDFGGEADSGSGGGGGGFDDFAFEGLDVPVG